MFHIVLSCIELYKLCWVDNLFRLAEALIATRPEGGGRSITSCVLTVSHAPFLQQNARLSCIANIVCTTMCAPFTYFPHRFCLQM